MDSHFNLIYDLIPTAKPKVQKVQTVVPIAAHPKPLVRTFTETIEEVKDDTKKIEK